MCVICFHRMSITRINRPKTYRNWLRKNLPVSRSTMQYWMNKRTDKTLLNHNDVNQPWLCENKNESASGCQVRLYVFQ